MDNGEINSTYELKKNKKLICGSTIFKFSKKYKWYESVVEIGNKQIQATIAADPNSGIGESVKTFNNIKRNFKALYETILQNCARELISLANDWKEEDDAEISKDEFINRIDSEDFVLEISGARYTVYFTGDEMFEDHGVIYHGNINNSEDFSADIA